MCQQRACRGGYAHADALYVTGPASVDYERSYTHSIGNTKSFKSGWVSVAAFQT